MNPSMILLLMLSLVTSNEKPASEITSPRIITDQVSCELSMPYSVILPVAYDASRKYPLVVLLHGYGGDPSTYTSSLKFLNSSDYLYLIAQAPYPFPIEDKTIGYAWMYFDDQVLGLQMMETSLRYLYSAIDKVVATYPIATNQIYVSGFSQGGAMCYIMLAHPGNTALAGIIPVGGFIPDTLQADLEKKKLVPILALHGKDDKVIPFVESEELHNKLVTWKYPAELKSYPIGHSLIPEELYDLDDFVARFWLSDPQSGSTPFMIKAMTGDDTAVQMMISGTRSGDPVTRIKTIRLLGFIQAPPAEIELCIRKGFERDAGIEEKIALCRACAIAKIPTTVDTLVKIAKDKAQEPELRQAAWFSLRRMGIPETEAALKDIPTTIYVVWIDPNKPGAKAGILVGDQILGVADKPVRTPDELKTVLSENEGKQIDIELEREKNKIKVSLIGGVVGIRVMEAPL